MMSRPDAERSRSDGRICVLVVEDETNLLSAIREILELEGFIVLTTHNGREALDIMYSDSQPAPDIIVSDIMMPEMDGFEFLTAVRSQDCWVGVPFIFLTAKGEKAIERHSALLGADVFLVKPFEAEELLVAVKSRLERHRNLRRVKDSEVSDVKRKILTILNHEFRTPLTLVVAYAEMLKDFDPGMLADNSLTEFLQGINTGADRLRCLIENFITLVEIESGEAAKTYHWRRGPILDLKMLVADAVRQVRTNYEDRHCQITIDPDLPPPIADWQQLKTIIRELVDNAFKFSDVDDIVTISIDHRGDDMRIEVTDHGRGIPKDAQANIWQTFFQFNREMYENQGSGSGLAIVQGLTQIHGGHCELESEVGVGTCVSVIIPLIPPDATHTP